MELKRAITTMPTSKVVIFLCVVLAMTGCTGEKKAGGAISDKVYTALAWRDEALEYDKAGQMRLAELYYKKAYELMKDEPSQDWLAYGDAGYRYACMLYQRGDMEVTLAVVTELLDRVEGRKDFPTTIRSGLLSLMAQCQMHLAMSEEAKQTFAKVYQNQLTVLGGENKGDLNMVMVCSNIFSSFFENADYDEAAKWLGRCEEELLACERLGVGDSALVDEQKVSLALYKAQYMQATGRAREAAAIYADIPRSQITSGENIQEAIGYLMAAGRYDEAAHWYEQLGSSGAVAEGERMTFDNITSLLLPRYLVYRKSGRNNEALVMADSIGTAIDSALVWQKKSDAAELAVIYQTHERDLQIKSLQYKVSFHRLLLACICIILLLIAYLFLRIHKYNKVLLKKNHLLLNEIEQHEVEEKAKLSTLQAQPEETLTAEQKLYRRLCTLMVEKQPYTEESLNRDVLAQMLGTNAKYVVQAIHECSNDDTVGAFINRYRLEHVAHLLKTTDDPISIIGELSGIPSRATLSRLFRNAYGMTCSEYRQAVKSKATEGPISSE